ncbi:hypothetical protein QZH41_001625 [Actinostola sp. cb2023]|nr:hypothetical protein QZH41_001625 [Actinostola sp. cb2023]
MSWTSNSLLLVVITCCGSLAILTKLGEPVLISTTGCSIDMGPGLYLPLHPRITFSKASLNGDSDTSMSSHSDVLRQRFSVTVHPNLPIIFTTDGYLVTVMQLPGNASYKEVMAMLMSATSSLVPEVQLDPNMVPLSSSTSTVNIFQSETNLSRMALELFKWDSSYRNAFTLALRLIHGSGCDDDCVVVVTVNVAVVMVLIGLVAQWLEHLTSIHEITVSMPVWARIFSESLFTGSPSSVLVAVFKKLVMMSDDVGDYSGGSLGDDDDDDDSGGSVGDDDDDSVDDNDDDSGGSVGDDDSVDDNDDDSGGSVGDDDDDSVDDNDDDSGGSVGDDDDDSVDDNDDDSGAVASFIERNQDETLAGLSSVDTPGDSLFGRRRAHLVGQEPNQSTPLRKTASLDRLLDVSTIGMFKPHESTTSTLLAILYLNLQHYNLRSALELVFSLMEPALDHLNATFSALFASTDALRVSRGQDYSSSQLLSVLLQNFPIVCVADKCGIPVVQTLGRFMAAYFSNLHLYVFPAYHPNVLPPFYLGDLPAQESTSDESFALSQGVEMVHLDREKVASAVRDQGISDVWCANNALELMLISGLIGEACWLSNNLGDWKHALLLSVSHSLVRNNIPVSLLPNIPQDITPEKIILSRLHPVLHSPPSSLPNIPRNSLDIPDSATSTPKKDRLIVEEPNDGKIQLEIDEKLVKDVGKILQAAVVAGLDVVPILCWKMLQELLVLVSHIDWIVPEGYYLPAPPLFCPQPPNVQTIAEQVEGLCWETLQWTLQLQPFGSFLGASAQVNDSLLTLLSEMQPSITTAQITAQHFPDSNLIHTTSGRAKFKRLMTQFRAITLREAGSIEEDNSDEPLSVFYREKCLEWEDELKERERLFNKVMIEVFQREINDDDLPHGSAKPTFLTNKDLPCVGSLVFETSQCYLEFLDTFFIITFTKTAEEMTGQATTAIPLLLPYEKLFTFTETKTLRELQVKTTVDKERKPPVETSLYRSQSYTDVRSTKPRQSFSGVQTGIRRSSSMSDVNKANSGIAVLGADILDMLPRLAWLSR